MDKVWCRDYLSLYHGQAHYMYFISPLDNLPPNLIQDVWLLLKARRMIRKHHVYLLISPFSRSMDLSSCDADLSLMLLLTSQRCFQLSSLSLTGCKIPKTQFSQSLPSLTRLTSLSLTHSSITDDLLAIPGLYCPLLASLDITYCTHISDLGLLPLFLPQDPSGQPSPRFGVCSSLSSLLVAGCQNITDQGVGLALLHLHHLAVLDYGNTAGVISDMMTGEGPPLGRSLLLRSLHCTPGPDQTLSPDCLNLALTVCPRVELVYLVTFWGMQLTSLLGLMDLSNLREVHIRNELGEFRLPLVSHFGPVLQAQGHTLSSLNLAELERVDLRMLCLTCPALIHLKLLWNISYVVHDKPGVRSCLNNLKTLEVALLEPSDELPDTELTSSDLFCLLSSPLLRDLKVSQCQTLTDDLLTESLADNTLGSVRKLELSKCDEITFEGLEPLLCSLNPLEEIKLVKCQFITRRDFLSYQKKVKKWKWNVKIHWE